MFISVTDTLLNTVNEVVRHLEQQKCRDFSGILSYTSEGFVQFDVFIIQRWTASVLRTSVVWLCLVRTFFAYKRLCMHVFHWYTC